MHGLFITGTDTSVGKTFVTAQLLGTFRHLGLRVGAYKPACSGAVWEDSLGWIWEDVLELSNGSGWARRDDWICPQRFRAPLAPPAAARAEGRTVDDALLITGASVWRPYVDLLLVEGAGGWLSPLSETRTVADVAVQFGYPVVVVAANRLGTINQTLLTLESILARGLPVAGVVLNNVSLEPDDSAADNAGLLRTFTSVPVHGPVCHAVSRATASSAADWPHLAQALWPVPRQ